MLFLGLVFVVYSYCVKEYFKEVIMLKFYLDLNKYILL